MPVQPADSVATYIAHSADSLIFFNEPLSFVQDSLAVDSIAADTLQQIITVETPVQIRYEGIPRAETFASQSGVTFLLLLQFFLLAFSFQIIVRQPGAIFKSISHSLDLSHQKALFTSNEVIQSFFLLVFSSLNLGFLFYIFFTGQHLLVWLDFLPIALGFFLLFLLKIAVFRLLGFVFFDKSIAIFWIQNNFSIHIFFNIITFPVLVWVIYTQTSDLYLLYTAVLTAVASICILIYRLLIIFPIRIYSFFHIILYLCTLEIAPIFLLYFFWSYFY